MSTKTRYTKDKYIRLIHVAMHKLNLDEPTYRAMLQRLTGKASCKQMKVAELDVVLRELEDKGFKNTARQFGGKTDRTFYSPATNASKAKSRITDKIRAVWIDMAKSGKVRDGSEAALNAWVRGVVNPLLKRQNMLILYVDALDDRMASVVLERLKKWQARGE